MEKSVKFGAKKARKRLMPLALRQWHLYRLDILCDHDDNGYRCPYFCIISQFDTLAPIFTNSDTDN